MDAINLILAILTAKISAVGAAIEDFLDPTLKMATKAAPAKTVGDALDAVDGEITEIKEDLSYLEDEIETGGGGVSATAIQLFNTILSSAVYKDDQKSNISALIAALSSGGGTTKYSVTNNLTNATTSNTARRVAEGSTYVATITIADFGVLQNVSITMGGTDITSTAYDNGNIVIEDVSGDIVITVYATVSVSLDDIAYGTLTYRDIFITGNMLTGFDFESGMPSSPNVGTPIVSDEDSYSPSHSLKCFGSSSNVLHSITGWELNKDYFLAMKIKCTRYSAGKAGMLLTGIEPNLSKFAVTDGWETISRLYLTKNTVVSNCRVGTMNSADMDAYIDDVVLIPIEAVFGESVTLSNLTAMYNRYCDLRKAGAT